ncbi:MAG: S-layer homology domain-containing protein, partial [Ruminococcaceae bacterium]|nr:S-layer homology domain-containing protein [Oscillospiraceae bacterium]
MKNRLLITLVFAVVLISVLSITASAKWWDENSFEDVKSDSWYYDAVRICNENELFNGTSDTTFTPNMKMSRAMLAQVLANADGYNKADYQGSSFKDVKATAWYASAVEWANQKGITTGVGGGKFAPDTLISREQLATMLRRYAEYKGMDITVENASFEGFADAD